MWRTVRYNGQCIHQKEFAIYWKKYIFTEFFSIKNCAKGKSIGVNFF